MSQNLFKILVSKTAQIGHIFGKLPLSHYAFFVQNTSIFHNISVNCSGALMVSLILVRVHLLFMARVQITPAHTPYVNKPLVRFVTLRLGAPFPNYQLTKHAFKELVFLFFMYCDDAFVENPGWIIKEIGLITFLLQPRRFHLNFLQFSLGLLVVHNRSRFSVALRRKQARFRKWKCIL